VVHAANLARLSRSPSQVDATRVPPGHHVTTDFPVAGCSAEEICGTLDVSEGNQRVLLHRARSRVRTSLERHLDG